MLNRNGLYDVIGGEHICRSTEDAISAAIGHIQQEPCIGCSPSATRECQLQSKGAPLEAKEAQTVQNQLTDFAVS